MEEVQPKRDRVQPELHKQEVHRKEVHNEEEDQPECQGEKEGHAGGSSRPCDSHFLIQEEADHSSQPSSQPSNSPLVCKGRTAWRGLTPTACAATSCATRVCRGGCVVQVDAVLRLLEAVYWDCLDLSVRSTNAARALGGHADCCTQGGGGAADALPLGRKAGSHGDNDGGICRGGGGSSGGPAAAAAAPPAREPTNYLLQHSTGSGKSLTIACLAHALCGWRDACGREFHTVLVVNDRTQLDRQLGDTIVGFLAGERWEGVLKLLRLRSSASPSGCELRRCTVADGLRAVAVAA
eukprot:195876-Chlamydomonas_euryale.AAC.3